MAVAALVCGPAAAGGGSGTPSPLDEAAAAMAIEGDAAYGAYLATECVTCHQPADRAAAIPPIEGLPRDAFIRALFEYKTDIRDHQVMRMVAGDLGNEEIAALAAYFGSLPPR